LNVGRNAVILSFCIIQKLCEIHVKERGKERRTATITTRPHKCKHQSAVVKILHLQIFNFYLTFRKILPKEKEKKCGTKIDTL